MSNKYRPGNIVNSIVPISRFNRGEASKIFEEVNVNGYKIVVKNNKPACVLLAPETYEEIMEALEDYNLFLEAEKRTKTDQKRFIRAEAVHKKLGISESDMEGVKVELE